jgi:hypothetical protein
MIVKIKEFDLKGEFANFFADFHTAKAETMHVYISIYTNAEGTVYANDMAGNPITDRLINYVIYTLPVSNEAQSIYKAGYMTIHFHYGNDFKAFDDNAINYWYAISGITPIVITPFT